MTLVLILLVTVFIANTVYLGRLIAADGLGHRPASGLPRSHQPDAFEPRRLAA